MGFGKLFQMDDVAKISLTAALGLVGGFIVGILTEPIKLYFQRSSKIRQMTVAVYREMAINYDGLVSRLKCQPVLKEGHHIYVHDIIRTDTILKQIKGDILYAQIPGIKAIEGFYMQFASFKGKGERPEDWEYARAVLNILNEAFKTNQLDRKQVAFFLPSDNRKRFRQMLRSR